MRVQINYKSGTRIVMEVESFSVDTRAGRRHVQWRGAHPNPLWLNIDQIESIYELTSEEQEDEQGKELHALPSAS